MIWPLKAWWTPRYAVDKFNLRQWEKKHPNEPWLTSDAIKLLATLLTPNDEGFEWGSGRSTIWFARRVAKLTSIETDKGWYTKTASELNELGLRNVNYIFREVALDSKSDFDAYTGFGDSFAPESLDFALVDGPFRSACANRVVKRLRPGGLLIIDDVHRFVPGESRSPKSRSREDGPRRGIWWEELEGLGWTDFLKAVEDWRLIWTSNGIKDTGIWIKTWR